MGATGATGRYVVRDLLERPLWKKVIVIGRRHYNPQDYGFQLSDVQTNKLENVVLPDLTEPTGGLNLAKEKFLQVDTVFNCIGTTRSEAGSAKDFVDIEYGITAKLSEIAKDCGVNHISVISAKSADLKMPALPWIRPMLYAVMH